MDELPEPPVPSDADLRGFPFLPIDVTRLLTSETWIMSTGDEAKAAMTLWLQSWQQVPAGSVPDNDRVLAHLSMAGPMWPTVKEMALRGWYKCNDSRLYHPVVCEKVLSSLKGQKQRKEAIAKRWKKDGSAAEPEKHHVDQVVTERVDTPVKQPEIRDEDVPYYEAEYEPDTGRIRAEVRNEIVPYYETDTALIQERGRGREREIEEREVQDIVPYGTRELGLAVVNWPQAMADIWNETCGEATAPVRKVDGNRAKTAAKRLKEEFGNDLEQWRAYCMRIREAPHLTGNNDRGWTANFDWVLKPDNLTKITEGNYDRRKQNNLFAFPGTQGRSDPWVAACRTIAERSVG
jgi:hypothetical protein